MPTHITQVEDQDTNSTVLRVDGQLLQDDARLIERIAWDIHAESGRSVVIDLADVDYLDSDAASVLRVLQSKQGIQIVGIEILLQNAVNEVERH
jgi:anti-anti-sigma regulatory factor